MIRSLAAFLALSAASLDAADWSDYYAIENIALPDTVDHQLGGIAALRDGRIAACFHSGEVMIYDPKTLAWTPFARGLQDPLGIVEDDDGALVVMQWSELTRLRDTDGDGAADHYQTVWDDFGVSGNYHEFAFGPARDKDGNYYVSLNVASNFAGTFKTVRGPVSPIGLDPSVLADWQNDPDWPKTKLKAGRMYSRVPYRGCVMKISPDGKGEVFAYGFRSPDGIGLDTQGRLWVTDNQGDWRGTSPLYLVEKDNFYGHPASLVWKPGWTRNPLDVPVEELQAMRTRAAALFPQGELANSPTQPISSIDPQRFGLPKGELVIGEMNQPTLIRFLEDKVNGNVQGTLIPFLTTMDLGRGNHRFAFDRSGALWVGKTHLGWAGDEGLKRISWKGNPILLVESVGLRGSGFRIGFNQALGEAAPTFAVTKHRYHYHAAYGSPKVDEEAVPVLAAETASDRRSVELRLPEIDEGFLYTIEIAGATGPRSNPLMGDVLRYNAVKLAAPSEDAFHLYKHPGYDTTPIIAGTSYHVHQDDRPLPPRVIPPENGNELGFRAPADATVLFDGTSLDQFKETGWSIADGILIAGKGGLATKQSFGDCQLHVEWMAPNPPDPERSGNIGNSGVFLMGRYELQIYDSYSARIYADGSAGAIYGQMPPLANVSRKPGEWQSFDVIFRAPVFKDGVLVKEAIMTALHNGVLVQDHTKILGPTRHKSALPYEAHASREPLNFQGHGSPVAFRNIWIRDLVAGE